VVEVGGLNRVSQCQGGTVRGVGNAGLKAAFPQKAIGITGAGAKLDQQVQVVHVIFFIYFEKNLMKCYQLD
jgi:hypothetical protein